MTRMVLNYLHLVNCIFYRDSAGKCISILKTKCTLIDAVVTVPAPRARGAGVRPRGVCPPGGCGRRAGRGRGCPPQFICPV